MTIREKSHFILAALVALLAATGCLSAQQGTVGLLVMAHGGDAQWNEGVQAAVEPLQGALPVEIAWGMADRNHLQASVAKLEAAGADRIAVVRLFVSSLSFREQTRYFLGLQVAPPRVFLIHPHDPQLPHGQISRQSPAQPRFVLSSQHPIDPIHHSSQMTLNLQGLYDSDLAGDVMVERVQALSREPEKETVVFIAHGEGDDTLNAKWVTQIAQLTRRVNDVGPFRAVLVETLREDWRRQRAEAELRIRRIVEEGKSDMGRVLIVPFRVFGFGEYAGVLAGLDYVADGLGLLPHPLITKWIREEASECFERRGWENPFQAGAGRR